MGFVASVKYAQGRIGSANGLRGQSQGGSDTIDHLAGASVEHLTATDFVAGTKAKPCTKGFGATPFTHVDADLRDNEQHTQDIEPDDLSQGHSTNTPEVVRSIGRWLV